MPKATSPRLDSLVEQLKIDFPHIEFIKGARFAWDATGKILYKKLSKNIEHDIFSLLHELGHAILSHQDYTHDIELLKLEVAAWEKAHELAERYGVSLDEDYIQDCLDSYRDWLHLRATCPTCQTRSLQASASNYHCHNCGSDWQVTRSRLCRPYRLQTT